MKSKPQLFRYFLVFIGFGILLPAVTNAQGLAGFALLVIVPLSIILFFVLLPIARGIQNLAGILRIQPSIKIDFIFALIIYLPLLAFIPFFSKLFYNDASLWHERALFVLPPLLVIIIVFLVTIIVFFIKKSIPHTIVISGLVFLWILIGGFSLIALERVDEKIMSCSILKERGCYSRIALLKNKGELCFEMDNHYDRFISTRGYSISNCLYNIAEKNKDEKVCDLIKKTTSKWGESLVSYDSCLYGIASTKEDARICALLSEDSNKQSCINAVDEFKRRYK